uniref:Uncharacterized protein n=1 Tax=Avena sativa TaxID=4498 RepID=A0ACD5W6V4_AVESA
MIYFDQSSMSLILTARLVNMSANMSESSGTSDAPSTAPHGRRSKVWEHFEQELVFVGDVPKAVCKYCAMKLTCNRNSGTSSLLSHISESCRLIGAEVRSRFLATLKKKSTDVGFVFDRKRSRQLMTKFCIHAEIPFKKFDDPYFEDWMDSMQPTFKVVGRHTVRSDCILTHDEMKDQLKLELQSLDSRICLTSDMWTSVQKLGYMCVTAHYIDANFVLKKKIISFKVVKYPHTKEAIEEALSRCLTEWGIKRKLFTITLDNAANNTGAVNNFLETQDHGLMLEGVDFHVRCCAHILNIVAQDGTQHIDVSVEKIRDLFRHVNSSGGRIQAFNTLATNKGLPEKTGLFLDIKTRWNSTFQMLVEAIKYRGVLNSYASENGEVTLNAKEWTNAEVICDFLKAFEEATNAVSADRKPTSQHFLHMVLCIRNALRDPQWKVNEGMHKLAISMGSKFDKYWNETKLNAALVIATVLDPRKKEDYLEFFFEKYCENYAESEKAMDGVSKSMKSYYQLYEEKVKRSSEYLVSREASINVGSPVLGKRKLEEEFARYRSRRRNFQPRSELDAYLEENFIESENFEILTWWKLNAEKYPVLSAMARDFLAVPLSTVSSESAFSCGGRILGDTRASLKPHALEALVCGKDWLIKVPSNEVQDQKSSDNELVQ